jgi:hypothetical protein
VPLQAAMAHVKQAYQTDTEQTFRLTVVSHSVSSACVIGRFPSIASEGAWWTLLCGDQNLVLVFRRCRIHPNVQSPPPDTAAFESVRFALSVGRSSTRRRPLPPPCTSA